MRPSVRAARQRRPSSSLPSARTSSGTAAFAAGPMRASAPATTAFVSSRASARASSGTAGSAAAPRLPRLHAANAAT